MSRSPIEWISREQDVALMGDYELPGQMEDAFTPYASDRGRASLGQAGTTPYNLNDPGAIIELKRALYELAKRDADPLRNPDNPILETRWKDMILDGAYATSWDGASADEFVLAISRYANPSGVGRRVTGPYMQIAGSRFGKGILGGPQPTAKGLEVIAGAVNERMGGLPRMASYLAWRDGAFDPPSDWSGPDGNATVLPITRMGPVWDPLGYTPVADDGVAEWVKHAASVDDSLIACWQQLGELSDSTEGERQLALQQCVLSMRRAHHQAALKANVGQPDPTCPQGLTYDRSKGTCVMPGTVTLPGTDIVFDEKAVRAQCISDYMAEGMSRRDAEKICPYGESPWKDVALPVAIGAASALGIWYFTRSKRKRLR